MIEIIVQTAQQVYERWKHLIRLYIWASMAMQLLVWAHAENPENMQGHDRE